MWSSPARYPGATIAYSMMRRSLSYVVMIQVSSGASPAPGTRKTAPSALWDPSVGKRNRGLQLGSHRCSSLGPKSGNVVSGGAARANEIDRVSRTVRVGSTGGAGDTAWVWTRLKAASAKDMLTATPPEIVRL